LRNNEALPSCLVQRLYSYGSGGETGAKDNQILEYFNERFAADGYQLRDLLRTIGSSESFTRVTDGWSPAPMEQDPNDENNIELRTDDTAHNIEPKAQIAEAMKK